MALVCETADIGIPGPLGTRLVSACAMDRPRDVVGIVGTTAIDDGEGAGQEQLKGEEKKKG